MSRLDSSNNTNLENCTFSKTILMLLVILYHSSVFWKGNWFSVVEPGHSSFILSAFSSWLNSFHVYGFALISGYIFAYKRMQGSYKKYLPFIKNKAKRLIIPYIFVASVWVIPFAEYYFRYSLKELILRYVLCTSPNQLWFLWMLFIEFVIAWPLWNISYRKPLIVWGVMLPLYAIGIICQQYVDNYFCIWTGFQFAVFFYIGMRIRIKEETSTYFINRIPTSVWVVLDAVLFILRIKVQQPLMEQIVILLLHLVGSIMSFKALNQLALKVKWREWKWLNALSRVSMPVFLFHQQIIYVVISLLNGLISPYVIVLLNFLISLTVSFGISTILMKWKTTRYLIGEK